MTRSVEETMNMMELPIDKVLEIIKHDFEDENYDPVIVLGKSGVGKTMSIYELTQKLGIGFCEMRLVTMTEVDLLGIPTIDQYGGTTYASNSLLPRVERDGECGILVLDEITSAERTVRAAAYQLLDSKRALGNYKLPPKWKCIALGNGASDGGVFQGMESAFLSRATCYRVEPDFNAWKKWAIPNGVNPKIIAFLNMHPEFIHKFDPDEIATIFPCSRSWTALSKKLNARESRGKLSRDMVEIYAAGAVGVEAANYFGVFYEYSNKMISIDSILGGTATTDIDDIESEAMYIAVQSLVQALTKKLSTNNEVSASAFKELGNAMEWTARIGMKVKDYAMVVVRDLTASCDEYRDIMIGDRYDELIKLAPTLPKFLESAQSLV